MSQDPYTTRRDFALPGQPSPAEPEGGQDGSDATPPLGAAHPAQRPPAIDFAQTVRDPAPVSGETVLDHTRPVPMPQQDRPAADARQDRQVAPLPQAEQRQPAPPSPQQSSQGYAPQGYPPPQGHPQQGFPPPGYAQRPPQPAAPSGGAWHRQHYAIGVFLVLYGLTNLVTGLLGFSNRKVEVAAYFGDGLAMPILVAVKCLEALLLAVTAAGLIRKRDVWFLPGLLGWVLGFAALCVLDLFKGQFVTLAEHAVYTLLFGVLLFLSYALSAKVRAARLQTSGQPGQQPFPAPSGPAPAGAPQGMPPQGMPPQGGPAPSGLSRTQEIALNTLNRWQRQGGR
ncbi:hypothetical protein ABGB12_06990 [Actinocorallia sp. B10E7]|uniref:hypothetical protein n=1 Tax=Actinocorallia sp. B10E7 TaxID=3153558 RepID=UPI00325F89AB